MLRALQKLSLFSLVLFAAACGEDDGMEVTPTEPPVALPTAGLELAGLELPDDVILPPPVEAWEPFDQFSNEFNAESKDDPSFATHWSDDYHNGWNGPGSGFWNPNNSRLEDGMLVLSATRRGVNQSNLGVMTSKETVGFPIYTEIRAKVANQVLSSNFWFLSPDDKREIDVLEIYGSDREDHTFFAARASTNYHVFERNPQTNAIIADHNEQQKHTLPGNEPWRNDFHRYGMYWKDAFTIDFYYDGELVHELRRRGITDPEGLGLDREMHLIIDLESHDWREARGHFASTEELNDDSPDRDYRIDYLRTFRPTEGFDGGLITNGSFDQTDLTGWYRNDAVAISTDAARHADGEFLALQLAPSGTIVQEITVVPNTAYTLTFVGEAEGGAVSVGVHDSESVRLTPAGERKEYSLSFTSGEEQTKAFVVIKNEGGAQAWIDRVAVR